MWVIYLEKLLVILKLEFVGHFFGGCRDEIFPTAPPEKTPKPFARWASGSGYKWDNTTPISTWNLELSSILGVVCPPPFGLFHLWLGSGPTLLVPATPHLLPPSYSFNLTSASRWRQRLGTAPRSTRMGQVKSTTTQVTSVQWMLASCFWCRISGRCANRNLGVTPNR